MKYSTIILAALASSASAQSLPFSSGGEVPSGLPTATKSSGSFSGGAFPSSAAGFRGDSGISSFPTGKPSVGSPSMSIKAAFGNQFAAGTKAVGGTGHRHTGSAQRTKSKHACKSASATLAARQDSSDAAIPTDSAPPGKPSGSGSFSHPSSHGSGRLSVAAQGSGCVAGNKASGPGHGGSKPTGFREPSGSMSGTPLSTTGAPNLAFIAARQASSDLSSGSFTVAGSFSKPTDGFAAASGFFISGFGSSAGSAFPSGSSGFAPGSASASGSSSFGAAGAKGKANFGQGFTASSGSGSLSQPTGSFASPSGRTGFEDAQASGGHGQGQGRFSYPEGTTKSGDYRFPTDAPKTFTTSIKPTTTA